MKKLILLVYVLIYSSQITYGQEVTIGTQIWSSTNLDVTTYRDGTPIPQVTDPIAWANLTTGAWCYYNNDPANGAIYGKLYNWYAVAGIYDAASLNDPSLRKQLSPQGWHVPTDAEWTTLTTFLGGESLAGGKMKSTGTLQAGTGLWQAPNTAATNESGFTGLPAGFRDYGGTWGIIGSFYDIGGNGFWWSSSEVNTQDAWHRNLFQGNGNVYRNSDFKKNGSSVRCLRDNPLSNITFDTSSLKLYPNPVLNILNLNVNSNLINQPYTIIDGLGRVILNGKLNEIETTINVEQLTKGVYYIKISGSNARKFIKE